MPDEQEKKRGFFQKLKDWWRQPRCYRSWWRRCGNCTAYNPEGLTYGFKDLSNYPVKGHCEAIAAMSTVGSALKQFYDRQFRKSMSDLINQNKEMKDELKKFQKNN